MPRYRHVPDDLLNMLVEGIEQKEGWEHSDGTPCPRLDRNLLPCSTVVGKRPQWTVMSLMLTNGQEFEIRVREVRRPRRVKL